MSHNRINYLERLHQNGCRLTKQRQVVLEAVCQADGHAPFHEILLRSKELDDSIDRSTVYRSLDLFVKLGLVDTLESLDGERSYEMIKGNPHHHLLCKVCGKDLEIANDLVDDFYEQLRDEYDYEISMDHFIVYGTCPVCKIVVDNKEQVK